MLYGATGAGTRVRWMSRGGMNRHTIDSITQEKFWHNLSSFYEKHPSGTQLSEKGTKDGVPLPDPSKDLEF